MKKDRLINTVIILFCCCMIYFSGCFVVNALSGNYINVLEDCSILSDQQLNLLQYFFTAIRIITPILVVVLVIMDFVNAVTSQKEDAMKKAQKNAIIRIAIGIVIMFVPTIVNLIIKWIGRFTTCGIK